MPAQLAPLLAPPEAKATCLLQIENPSVRSAGAHYGMDWRSDVQLLKSVVGKGQKVDACLFKMSFFLGAKLLRPCKHHLGVSASEDTRNLMQIFNLQRFLCVSGLVLEIVVLQYLALGSHPDSSAWLRQWNRSPRRSRGNFALCPAEAGFSLGRCSVRDDVWVPGCGNLHVK